MKPLFKIIFSCITAVLIFVLSSCNYENEIIHIEDEPHITDGNIESGEHDTGNNDNIPSDTELDTENRGNITGDTEQDKEENAPSVGLEYALHENKFGYAVVGIGTCKDTDIIIPTDNLGMSVISIGAEAFRDCSHIESITLSENIRSVDASAFEGCVALKKITVKSKALPEGLENVYMSGSIHIEFDHEHTLISIDAKEPSCEEQGWEAYSECTVCGFSTLEYIDKKGHTPDAAKEENRIEAECMQDGKYDSVIYCETCGEEMSRTERVISAPGHIGAEAVCENYNAPTCTSKGSYKSVVYCDECGTWMSTRNVTVDKIPHDFENEKCKWCERSEFSEGLAFTLNEDETSYTLSGIGTCTDTEILIPKNYNGLPVTHIGANAFYLNRTLISVTVGENITDIGEYAFYGCSFLENVNIGSNVKVIGSYAFEGCIFGTLIIPDSVAEIESWAFRNCTSLKNVDLGEGLKSIGHGVFYNCTGLTSVTVPDSVTYIGNSVFSSCSYLTRVELGDGIEVIGQQVFKSCVRLKDVVLHENLTSIGKEAFKGCIALVNITLPESLMKIGEYAFDGCNKLGAVTLPNSVTTIGSYAFKGCTNLKSVVFEVTEGWYISTNENTIGSICYVSNASNNAEYLVDTYCNHYWKRKQ